MRPLVRLASHGGLRTSLLAFVFIAALAVGGSAAAGTILPGQYFLLDHPDGEISPPPYGLRMDDLGYTFSTELNGASVILDWDDLAGTATISGTLWNNQLSELWTVSYTLTGVVAEPGNLGFKASAGSGLLTDPLLNDTVLTGESMGGGGPVFEFLADGYRISGDNDTPVGRGWLLPAGSTDDWLVTAVPVPEPTTALMLGLGLAVMGVRRRN